MLGVCPNYQRIAVFINFTYHAEASVRKGSALQGRRCMGVPGNSRDMNIIGKVGET